MLILPISGASESRNPRHMNSRDGTAPNAKQGSGTAWFVAVDLLVPMTQTLWNASYQFVVAFTIKGNYNTQL